MKTKALITAVLAMIIVAFSFTNADAHRGGWGRHGFCRPARVVVVPVIRPRMVCPPRYYAPVPRVRVYHHRGLGHRRHC